MELFNVPINTATYPCQQVNYTSTAASITGFPPDLDAITVWSTTPCYIAVGTSPSASSVNIPIPENTMVPIKIPDSLKVSGSLIKISVVRISTDGTLYAIPTLRY